MRAFIVAMLLALSFPQPAQADIATWIGTHRAECLAWFQLNPEVEQFPRLPVICNWRPADYYCRAENDPPDAWLRPGGFCEVALATKSLGSGKGDGVPDREVPCQSYKVEYEPCPE